MKKIAFVLGTKAQFIKSKYVLMGLINKGVCLLMIDTGQHREITQIELKEITSKFSYLSISDNKKNISSIFSMISWFTKILFNPYKIPELKECSYCILHGDTISTLVGLIVAKKNNVEIIHLESGLKSGNWLKPFPEEIVRSIVTRFSDVLIIDSKESERNVAKYSKSKQIIRISRNTIFDSVVQSARKLSSQYDESLIVTIHRTENIYNKNRLYLFVNLLMDIKNSNNFKEITWYCHDITSKALQNNGLDKKLLNNGIALKNLLTHDEFIEKICKAKAVITDGGSISEECSILGINTVIWRDVVENEEYLNNNVILSNYNTEKVLAFLSSELSLRSSINYGELNKISPSEEVVNKLLN